MWEPRVFTLCGQNRYDSALWWGEPRGEVGLPCPAGRGARGPAGA